jgi:pimeloyl-ACP methyl ester carboxylesterase
MSKAYEEELVSIAAEDGLPLEGAVIRPVGRAAHPVPLVYVHGLSFRFYAPEILRIGRALAGHGYTFVTGNNRGHDGGYSYRPGPNELPRIYGGCWENIFDAPLDIRAWIGFTVGLGFERIALLGHSLGGRKVVPYQADSDDPRVAGLVLASPPVDSYRPNPAVTAQARARVAEGRGMDLLPWGVTGAAMRTMGAQAYLDRYQPGWDHFGLEDPDPAIGRVRCPILAFYGTEEPAVGGASELEMFRVKARAAARIETHLIEGADHTYTGKHDAVGQILATWMETLSS